VRTPIRLAVVAAGLGAVFAAAVGVGAAVGPVGAPGAHPAAAAPAPEHAVPGTGYVLDVLEDQPAAVTEVDGYTVVLTGEPAAGAESELTFSVSRDGRPVTDLQPYLGAYGHLVALRDGDLEYLHVHPVEDPQVAPAPGPHVAFAATAPSAGTHRLFLDFRHGDAVHTAAFTVQVAGTAADEPAAHGHGG